MKKMLMAWHEDDGLKHEDDDGLEHEEDDEEEGAGEDGVCLSLFFLIVNLRIQNCISYQQF